jgi:sugar fermentation stimulation protein A
VRFELVHATFLRRYQRFFADVRLDDGRVVTVHVPNTGSMRTLLHDQADAWLRPAADPTRKLPFTLVLLGQPGGHLALVDTSLPNALAAESIAAGAIAPLRGYPTLQREAPYQPGSRTARADLRLAGDPTRPDALIEIKNVTMLDGPGRAAFPDSVSDRATKHLHELMAVRRDGRRAVLWFLVSRSDARQCAAAEAIDPTFARTLDQALSAGVEVLCHRVEITRTDTAFTLALGDAVPFIRVPG